MKIQPVSLVRSPGLPWLLRVIDLVLTAGVGVVVCLLWLDDLPQRYIEAFFAGGALVAAVGTITGLYREWHARSLLSSTRRILSTWVTTWVFLLAAMYLLKIGDQYSRGVNVIWFITVPVGLIGYRVILRMLLRRIGWNTRRVAIVGANEIAAALITEMKMHRWMGLNPTCVIDDNAALQGSEIESVPVSGTIDQLAQIVESSDIAEVFICLSQTEYGKMAELFDRLTRTHAIVKYVPDIFSFSLMCARLSSVGGIPVVSVYDSPLSGKGARLTKTIMDKTLATLILTVISPLMIAIAIGVKATSPGPVFYRQTRVGINNRPFEMLKFRSMPVDADARALVWGDAASKTSTRFGSFLRKSSLDELPQFINVLRGEMSIVGPRPERDVFVEQFKHEIPRYMQKHMVKAGITGLAQVNGLRGDTCLKSRVEHDIRYISEWSLWLDVKIILRTVGKVFYDASAR